uniref:Putative hemolymph juvenile hormone binding protein n=1 Tax=Xenopsylla cheopis TaxID=163159 RepID=A0A6M2DWL5_XENCH
MNLKLFVFFFVYFLQYSNVESAINQDMVAFFERLQEWMPYLDCIEEIDLPVMEPLFTETLDFDLVHEIGKFKGNFANMTIKNLSKYNVDLFNLNIIMLTVKANMSLPEIRLDGLYKLDGNIGDLIPIFGEGNLEISLQNITVGVVAKMKAIPFSIQDLKIDFKIQGFKGHFYGLMGDPELEETFNKLINDIALEALDVLWPEIEVGLVDMIKQMVADANLSLTDMLKLMKIIKEALPLPVPDHCKHKSPYNQQIIRLI